MNSIAWPNFFETTGHRKVSKSMIELGTELWIVLPLRSILRIQFVLIICLLRTIVLFLQVLEINPQTKNILKMKISDLWRLLHKLSLIYAKQLHSHLVRLLFPLSYFCHFPVKTFFQINGESLISFLQVICSLFVNN
jgi:hypothetical protein